MRSGHDNLLHNSTTVMLCSTYNHLLSRTLRAHDNGVADEAEEAPKRKPSFQYFSGETAMPYVVSRKHLLGQY